MNPTKIIGVYDDGKFIYTKNKVPGERVYDEDLVIEGGIEYRKWDAKRSKVAAYIRQRGVRDIFVRPNNTVLYLGCSNGTTSSHISDILGGGMLFGVDFAFRVMMDFVVLSEERDNLSPILASARHPESYEDLVPKEVDLIIQDVAQRDQAQIFIDNVKKYLKVGGFGLFAVKSRSIDVRKRPKQVFQEVRAQLEKEFTIVDFKPLEPFERDHVMIVVKKNK